MSSFKFTDKKQKYSAEQQMNQNRMENVQRQKSCQNTNSDILFKNCNVKKVSQKPQIKEKFDTKQNIQKQADLTRAPNTLQNSGIFIKYDDTQQSSFHSSFQNLSNPKHFNYQNQFKNDSRNQQIKNLNNFDFDENNQKHLNSKIENSDSIKLQKINDYQISKKLQNSPMKKNQNAQNVENIEKQKNNFENKFQLFNQATYLNKINIKQASKDLNNQTQESSYIEYAKKIIKQSDEQLQLLQRLTPRKRQSQEKQKKSQNQFQIQTDHNMFQKVIQEDFMNQKGGSKLKLIDCSPSKQDENQYFSKIKKNKKPSQKQILNQEQYIIDQIRLEHSKYQKRTKNRPKSSGFSHQQSQLLRKKSNKHLLEQTKNHSKLDISQKSQESQINSTLTKQQNHISVNITNDKINQMDSCISIRQFGTPSKIIKSQTKLNNTKELVSKSLVFKKKKESKYENKSKEESTLKQRLKQTQSTNRIQHNVSQRCNSTLNQNDSFVQQKVKNMQQEYLKSKLLDSSKDISIRKSQIVLNNHKDEKLKQIVKEVQSQAQTSFIRQKSSEQDKYLQSSQNLKQQNNEILSKLRQNLFQENKNQYQSEIIKDSQSIQIELHQNENGKLIQKNYLRASKNQIQKKQSQKKIDAQQNISILEEALQSSQNQNNYEKLSKIQSIKEVEIPFQKQEQNQQFQKQKQEAYEEQKSKKQTFSHIKIITKPPENVQQEMNKVSQKQSKVSDFTSYKKQSVSPQKIKTQNISPQNQTKKKLHFIFQKFGAILKGYKTRRIYNHSKLVKQDRFEFRDLIQFAYSLKQELAQFQNKMKESSPVKDRSQSVHIKQKLEGQIEQTKKLLLQSLKDLIQKRQQFSIHFNRLLEGNTDWIHESKNVKIKNCSTPDNKYSQINFLRKSSSLEPFLSNSQNTKKKMNVLSPNKQKITLKSPSQKNTENSSFKESKMQSEIKDQYRKPDNKQSQSQNIKNQNHDDQQKSQQNIKQNWNEQKDKEIQDQNNKVKNQSLKQDGDKMNNNQNEYNNKNQSTNFADHLSKKLQQKKRQISQLTFGESADAMIVNQSRTESIMDIRKFQKDNSNNNGLIFNKKINEDNFNSVQDSPSKKFQSIQKGFNSIKDSPNKICQTYKVQDHKSNFQNSVSLRQSNQIEVIGSKKYRDSSKISEPCIVHNNYESTQLFNIGKERDQLIEEQLQLDTESQFQQKQLNGQKKSFLKKGEKSRKQFDPQRSIQNQKLQKQQSKDKMTSLDNQNDLQTLPNIETKERSNSLNMNSQKCLKNQRSLTPQSHKKSLNRFIQGYQSPYQQANSLISIMKQDEVKIENKQEIIQLKNMNIPNQSPSHLNDQRWNNKMNNNLSSLRNEKKFQNNKNLQNQKDMNLSNNEIISISINQQEEKRKSINFISKIPRLSSVSASMCKSEIEQKNKSPNKSPIKQATKNEDIIKNANLMKKNSVDNNNKNMENQKFSNLGKNNRLTNESKSDINLRQSDQNQNYLSSHHSSIIVKSANRKNSIIEKCSNQQSSQQKKEHLLEINQIIKQQNLQYIKNLSSVKQQTKPSTKMSNCSNQELSQELNKLRQSLVFKNLGIQKQNLAQKPDQGHLSSTDNNHSKIFECSTQEQMLQKQSFSQQKLSMSTSKKILQMSKSKPSNRYHEKSESDTFSQINICDNFKKDQNLNIIEKQKESKIQNCFYQNEISKPEIIREYNQIIFEEQIVEVIKTQRQEIDQINRFNENSPSINDISAAGSNLSSPQSKITYRHITNFEKLTPIKNMNFENQYVANLKKLKKEGANSPKRPNFIKQAPQTNFEFSLVGMMAEQKDLNSNSYQKIIEVDEDQFSNKEVNQNNLDQIEQKPDCEVTISIFDNKQNLFNMGLSSNFESQNGSFQKQSIELQSQILKNEDQNYNNQKQELLQQGKRNGSHLSRFLNHNQDMNQSNNHNECSTDKDTSTFRIQPLKINSIANTSSLMSSVRGEMIITNNVQTNYNPIQSCNHTKYNSIYDVISTSIMNPCCSETIHKYGQSPGAKSQSPIHKMGSVNKNQDYSSQVDIYSPTKKSPSKILNKQSHSKENIVEQNNENIYQRLNEDISDNQSLSKLENQVFLYPQIISGKQNKDLVQQNTQNEKHFKSIQILQSQENKIRGTESRRRSRGERTSQQKQQAPKQNNYTRNKLNANLINTLSQNKINLNQTEIIQEIYQHTQNSLEQPDSNVPKALPTPQRHYQFQYQIRTPTKSNFDDRQSTINSNTAKQFSQYDIEASCSKTINSKRLTQLKRSNQGKNIQISPFKTPQKSQVAQQKQISAARQQTKTETSYKKSLKLNDNQIQQQNNEIEAQKVSETIEQLKFVLSRLKSQEQIQNQYISEEHITKSRQIEQMIKNLQEQQIMFNQFINEQSNLNIR